MKRWPPAWVGDRSFAVFDLETTGPDPEKDRIVQIGILQINGGMPITGWETLVNPGCPIPAEATAIHGISDRLVAHAPSFKQISDEVLQRLDGRIPVGYHIRSFDQPMLVRHFAEIGIEMRGDVLDVLTQVRHYDRYTRGKGRHRLQATAARWGVDATGAHGALPDCHMCWRIFAKLVMRFAHKEGVTVEKVIDWQEREAPRQDERFEAWRASQDREKQREEEERALREDQAAQNATNAQAELEGRDREGAEPGDGNDSSAEAGSSGGESVAR